MLSQEAWLQAGNGLLRMRDFDLRHRCKNTAIGGLVFVMLGLSFSACKTVCMGVEAAGPPVFQKIYEDDTPEHLADSYIFAWGQMDDDAVYYFRTPLKQQNAADRETFIEDGANKCRWHPESWWMDEVTYDSGGARAVLDVSLVYSEEGYTRQNTLRFNCVREGKRWWVEETEWVGDSKEWGVVAE